ncbi:MAG: RNA polymerase sigma factor [Bacteroidota bacterium]
MPRREGPKKREINPEERELLRRCIAGEVQAHDELCRKLRPAAMRMARHITRELGDAEDLVQESFCRLLSHLKNLRGEASITTWLYRTLTNLYRDKLRRLAKRPECPLDAPSVQGLPVMTAPDPAELVENRLWRRGFVAAVKKLSRRDRKVLWLHFRRDYSHAQIAARLNCTVDAVKCRLYRVTRHLRQELALEI